MRIFNWASKHLIPRFFDKIRVGNNEDGGYVLPKVSVEQCDLCVTFGLGSNITFEEDLKLPWLDGSVMDYNFS